MKATRRTMHSAVARLPRPARVPSARAVGLVVAAAAGLAALGASMLSAVASGPQLAISQVPLTMTTPGRPRVLLAVSNSQSMDATLGGAIMTGSGMLTPDYASLNASSSPKGYTVPAGFTPPLQAADASGVAPFTMEVGGFLLDNGASRLNIVKAGIQSALQAYAGSVDFGLASYSMSTPSVFPTWVYYLSPDGGFSFTSTPADDGSRYVPNPCHGYSGASTAVAMPCNAIAASGLYDPATLSAGTLMRVAATSDDVAVNDLLYGRTLPGVFVDYGVPVPPSSYPPNYSLVDYNNGVAVINYPSSVPEANRMVRPSDAGYAPSPTQLMYAARGFGYLGNQSASSGAVLAPMTALGATPSASDVSAAIDGFSTFLQPETSNPSSAEIKAAAVQAPVAGLLATVRSYLGGLSAPPDNGCATPQVVVLVTDGQPTQDLNGHRWPPLGSAAATNFGVSATFNADGSLASTNNQALQDAVDALKALAAAGVKTYIVGIGAAVDPAVNVQAAAVLQAMALAGGTRGFYPASSASTFVDALGSVLVTVQNGSISGSAAAVSSSALQSESTQFQASFTSSDTPYQDWTGDVVATKLDAQTGVPASTPLWSARTQLDDQAAHGTRLIATWNQALNGGGGRGVPFRWANLDPTRAISAAQQAMLQPGGDGTGMARLAYLRGSSAGEVRAGGTFRNRSHILGDIVNSQPLYVGAPAGPYFTSSYLQFRQTQAARPPMVYVGANDGMLHAFDAATGNEAFAFVPSGVFANLYQLSTPLYNQHHQYFVDGSPQAADVTFADGSWHTMVIGGEGGGGRSVYALDVTNPQSLTNETAVANAAKWEFDDPNDLGLTYSVPQVAPITAASGFAVFFGNGYNSTNNHAVLYALNPETGALIAKMDLCVAVPATCVAGVPQGLSTVAVGQADGLQGQPITQVYAGDLQGNLWAIDVSNSSVGEWKARLLFRATDASGAAQPITTAPVVTLHPSYPRRQGLFVMFGTGSLLTPSDLLNLQTQTIYGVWDKPAATAQTYGRADLQQQTLTLVTAATSGFSQDILTDTSNAVNFASQVGWYADLPVAGQRVMTDPLLLNGTFLTTLNQPAAGGCGAAGTPMLLEVNFATGGAFTLPQLDLNGNLTIDSGDLYNGLAPVGIGLGSSRSGAYASGPTVRGPNANNQMVKGITLSTGGQVAVLNPNNNPRTASWWQIQ
jgi:type IV pilus assembly protein PilY1